MIIKTYFYDTQDMQISNAWSKELNIVPLHKSNEFQSFANSNHWPPNGC